MVWLLFLLGFILDCITVMAIFLTPFLGRGREIDPAKINSVIFLSLVFYFAALVYNFIW